MFQGRKMHSLDSKGRVSVPEEYRRVLAVQGARDIVLTRHPNPFRRCILAWTPVEWAAFVEKIGNLPLTHPHREFLDDMVLSTYELCSFDANGRIVLSQFFRGEFDLAGKVLFLGRRQCFEVWSPKYHREMEEEQRKKTPQLSDYGI